MDDYNRKWYELGVRTGKINIKAKLLERANYHLKNITKIDSPMILVATELRIMAEEINTSSQSLNKEKQDD